MNENNVPAGWKLVPREPTPEMQLCGEEWIGNPYLVRKIWDAMVAAADSSTVAQPPATAEAVKRMASIFAQQNGWDGADGAPEWLVELVQDVANALATPPQAPVQQTEAVTLLAEDCKDQARKCAMELRAMGFMPGVTEKLEWGRAFLRYEAAIDRLAAIATQPQAPVQQTEAVTRERLTDAVLSDLFEIANELHGEFDKQTYDEKRRADWDLPDDHEFSVTITAAQERALSQAIIGIEASTGEQSHG